MIANKHATLHLQHFRNDLVLFNESYPINPVSYSYSPPIHRRGNALFWNWFLHLSIFTSLYILKLKVERENIRFKIPTTAIDVKFKWLLYNWIAKNINWISANLSSLKRFILNSTTVATLSLAARPRLQWKNVPIFKGINVTPPLSFSSYELCYRYMMLQYDELISTVPESSNK